MSRDDAKASKTCQCNLASRSCPDVSTVLQTKSQSEVSMQPKWRHTPTPWSVEIVKELQKLGNKYGQLGQMCKWILSVSEKVEGETVRLAMGEFIMRTFTYDLNMSHLSRSRCSARWLCGWTTAKKNITRGGPDRTTLAQN